jgi:hypothetical protein
MLIGVIIAAVLVAVVVLLVTGNHAAFLYMFIAVTSFALIYGSMIWWPSFECEQKVAPSGYECTWDLFAGCQVNIDGRWVPYEKWRVFE